MTVSRLGAVRDKLAPLCRMRACLPVDFKGFDPRAATTGTRKAGSNGGEEPWPASCQAVPRCKSLCGMSHHAPLTWGEVRTWVQGELPHSRTKAGLPQFSRCARPGRPRD